MKTAGTPVALRLPEGGREGRSGWPRVADCMNAARLAKVTKYQHRRRCPIGQRRFFSSRGMLSCPMNDATLEKIFRYPIKSMMGESLESAQITDKGLVGDRAWAVRDEQRGGIRGGKKIPALMTLAAKTAEPAPQIVAPDGDSACAGEDGIHEWLSGKLDHPVTLWPILPADQLDHYRRGAPDSDDFEAELRAVFGRLPDEPLPDLTPFMEVLEFELSLIHISEPTRPY